MELMDAKMHRHLIHKAEKQRDQFKAENEKLKEELERLNGIIKDEEDWKLLELEERWE